MRETPDIDQRRRQAKELREAYRTQSPDAVAKVDGQHRTATPETLGLHHALFVLARSYGLESWPKCGHRWSHDDEVARGRRIDLGAVRALLARRPTIVDLLHEGPSGFEIRAIHIAVMARAALMQMLLRSSFAPETEAGLEVLAAMIKRRCKRCHRRLSLSRSTRSHVDILAWPT